MGQQRRIRSVQFHMAIQAKNIEEIRKRGGKLCGNDDFEIVRSTCCGREYLCNNEVLTLYLNPADLGAGLSNFLFRGMPLRTGSMLPLKGFAPTDAPFNLGFAIGALTLVKPGVYLAMNGKLFPAGTVKKNVHVGRFEAK